MEGITKPTISPLHPHPDHHHFYAYLGRQQGLSDQSPHTHTHACTNGEAWSPSRTNDDVREQSQTHRAGGLFQSLSARLSLPSTGPPLSSVLSLFLSYLTFFSLSCIFLLFFYPTLLSLPSASLSPHF